ncbi:MAG TPA: branched-chain amino acid ABC transporter permease [Mesorhizobium sp.]|uniref:branched-chain amino acid ABC transporter permease n=1 Tax=Mesorhizobium sp. TaxID=1871066 RepID=UPI002DDD8548|nr:branched-chain amino acid ABC transporter permease [Mesorhizobium sp.]HEV2501822.1 branched-chain amino acid ABC transporter permease [Mesorhizobium sp.]
MSTTSRSIHALALALLVAVPLMSDGRYLPTVMISIVLLWGMGMLFDFMLGYLNIVNFGMAGFLCAGAYAAALSTSALGVSPWIGVLIGGVAGLLLGVVTGVLTLRLKGVYVGLTTLFVMEFLRFSISSARDVTRGMSGLTTETFPTLFGITFSRGDPLPSYYLLLAIVVAIYLALKLIVGSRIGLLFRAIRDDELGVEVLGFNIVAYKLLNFAIATGLMGVIGAFYAYYIGILVPTPQEFGIPRTVEILTVAYIGGRGTLWGSLLGAACLVGIQEVFRDLEEWRLVIYGVFLVFVLIAFPKGLAGALEMLGKRFVGSSGETQAPSTSAKSAA